MIRLFPLDSQRLILVWYTFVAIGVVTAAVASSVGLRNPSFLYMLPIALVPAVPAYRSMRQIVANEAASDAARRAALDARSGWGRSDDWSRLASSNDNPLISIVEHIDQIEVRATPAIVSPFLQVSTYPGVYISKFLAVAFPFGIFVIQDMPNTQLHNYVIWLMCAVPGSMYLT